MDKSSKFDDENAYNILEHLPVCISCDNMLKGTIRKCRAFPDKIPDDIWYGKNNHSEPFIGDQGIRYLKK